jgi:hypothetical protein
MSWYGSPKLIVSDNAKQFGMADRVFERLMTESDDLREFIRAKFIEWKFVVEKAPWMGGFYERMVAIVKNSLKSALHTSKLSLTELQTVVYETCAVINTRPLTYSEDEVGYHSISPSHLLMRHPSIFWSVPAAQADEYYRKPKSSDQLILTWNRLQNVLQTFWKTWKRQYLAVLRDTAWYHPQRNVIDKKPSVGDVVVVHDDNHPRAVWRLARIKELIPSFDGVVRSVVLKLPNRKTLRRPIKLLHPLEMSVTQGGETQPSGKLQSKDPDTTRTEISQESEPAGREGRQKRKAAIVARHKFAKILSEEGESEQC